MTKYDACEQAYKSGYEAGQIDMLVKLTTDEAIAYNRGYAARDEQIVRCGWCKFGMPSDSHPGQICCTRFLMFRTPESFCSDGDPRIGDNDEHT